MSLSCFVEPGIGWEINSETLFQNIAINHLPVTHKENRYDSKTGKEIKPEIIIDEEGYTEYKIGDEIFDDEYEFLCTLNSKLKYCKLQLETGYSINNKEEDRIYIILKSNKSKFIGSHPFNIIKSIDIPDNIPEKLEKAKEEIKNILKFELKDKPKILCIYSIS